MKNNNRKVPISEQSKAYYRNLMHEIALIEYLYKKKDSIVKFSPDKEQWVRLTPVN